VKKKGCHFEGKGNLPQEIIILFHRWMIHNKHEMPKNAWTWWTCSKSNWRYAGDPNTTLATSNTLVFYKALSNATTCDQYFLALLAYESLMILSWQVRKWRF
jgi:hypothetical protein